MPAYAYPIIIKRDPQSVRYERSIPIDTCYLTLDMLKVHNVTENERFSINETEPGHFQTSYILSITGTRLETPEEVNIRVKKEEEYMAEYNRRQAKKNEP